MKVKQAAGIVDSDLHKLLRALSCGVILTQDSPLIRDHSALLDKVGSETASLVPQLGERKAGEAEAVDLEDSGTLRQSQVSS